MTPRQKRLVTVVAIIAGVGIATTFALQAFNKNLLYYYSPTQISAGEAPSARSFRVGGLVENGSVKREPGSLEVRFTLTDYNKEIGVSYTGVLPDLFREGQGIIARGKLDNGVFVAEEVLAKHDENYMPPEVKQSLQPHMDAANTAGEAAAPAATAPPGST
jgi:cytochrome c-type biogenesis protein CcmE